MKQIIHKKIKKNNKKKIAILTSGGDCPGMNTAIYSLVRQCLYYDYEPYLVFEGYKGLVEDNIVIANYEEVKKNAFLGGSFIYSARLLEFKELLTRQKAALNLKKRSINTLIVIGGDGSYQGAKLLSELGINCICLPGTIDNDIASSDWTIGFYTALESIDLAISQIKDTSISHNRVGLVEVMGRYCGDLAMYSSISSCADLIITSENFMQPNEIAKKVKDAFTKNKKRRTFTIVITERMYGANNNPTLEDIASSILKTSGHLTNINRLGYLQRGGMPNFMDRILAIKMGMYAIDLISKNKNNRIVSIKNDKIVDVDFKIGFNLKRPKHLKEIQKLNSIQEKI
ncbi:ATP-dependent 6-phosphofructokinase [Mycoplasmoides alvi]|uniref:ATP-dependent 6-phosphofructokinase n=1 Tax=Mycoplasmoides alvi TaxID=78580 RepID=UPI0006966B6A|nr:ATP-dependent 6-phosphofructokinase [Mycoplasmoides alvi]